MADLTMAHERQGQLMHAPSSTLSVMGLPAEIMQLSADLVIEIWCQAQCRGSHNRQCFALNSEQLAAGALGLALIVKAACPNVLLVGSS